MFMEVFCCGVFGVFFSRGEQFKEKNVDIIFFQRHNTNTWSKLQHFWTPLDTKRGESMMDFQQTHTAAVSLQTRIHLLSTSLPEHDPLVFSSSPQTTLSFSGSCVSWFIRHKFYWDSLMPFFKWAVLFHGLPNVTGWGCWVFLIFWVQ